MLREAVDPAPLHKVGDASRMRMRNDEMDDHVMANHVVEYEQDRRIGWEPEIHQATRPQDAPEIGVRALHRWTYELAPEGEGTTYDYSLAPEWLRNAVKAANAGAAP
jgi:hypothetical protein